MKYYIGLDAHSSTSTAGVVNEAGEMLRRQTFPTTEGNLHGFLRSIPEERHLTFEEYRKGTDLSGSCQDIRPVERSRERLRSPR